MQHDDKPDRNSYLLAYFDTNVLGALFRNSDSWEPVRKFLQDNHLRVGISDVNVLELSSIPVAEAHRNLAHFLLGTPSVWLKPATRIMREEVQAYLQETVVHPVVGPISGLATESDDPVGALAEFFRAEVVAQTRSKMEQRKPEFEKRINETRRNFRPIVDPERFTEADGPYYAFQLIWQILCQDWPGCATKLRKELTVTGKTPPTLPDQFRGFWLFALAQFYRYYLHRHKPHGNDYGDLIQTVPIPYCRHVVVENILSQDLLHIKGNDPILEHTEIYNLRFLRDLTGLSLG